MKDMSIVPFVEIVWDDAADFAAAWLDYDRAVEFGTRPTRVVSRGWLISKNKDYTVLAADYIEEDKGPVRDSREQRTLGRVTKIPTPWIRSVREIRIAKRRR